MIIPSMKWCSPNEKEDVRRPDFALPVKHCLPSPPGDCSTLKPWTACAERVRPWGEVPAEFGIKGSRDTEKAKPVATFYG